MDKVYDVIILGIGPGRLAAGIYVGRARLDTLLIKKGKGGGQIAITDEIESYPGQMVDGENGPSLIERTTKQVGKFGAKRTSDTIVSIDIEGPIKTLIRSNGTYKARTLIIAIGAFPRPIGCKGEGEFVGKGVSCCAAYDVSFLEDLEVFVVGGGDSTVEEAICPTKFARKVTVIHRHDELCAAKSIRGRAFENPKLSFVWDIVVEEFHGDGILFSMAIKNAKTGELTRIDASEDDGLFSVFGFIGHSPRSELFEGKLEMGRGHIKVDEDMHTNMGGVYTVGDIHIKSSRQVVTTTTDEAIASMQVKRWLTEQKQVTHSRKRGVIPTVDLTRGNSGEEVLKAEGIVLVDFYGSGRVSCRALMPHIHTMEGDCGGEIKFASLSTTKARHPAIGQKVLGLPVIVIYEGGKKIAECVKGDATVENIKVMIETNL